MTKTRIGIFLIIVLSLLSIAAFTIQPLPSLLYVTNTDPSAAPGIGANLNSLAYRTDVASLYIKSGPAKTNWTKIGSGGAGGGVSTVGSASGDITITNPATTPDLAIEYTTHAQKRITGAGVAHKAITNVASTGVATVGFFVDTCASGTSTTCSVTSNSITTNVSLPITSAGPGQAATAIAADGTLTYSNPDSRRRRTFIEGDFMGTNANGNGGIWDGRFLANSSGTAATVQPAPAEAGHDGIASLLMGTTTTGRADVVVGGTGSTAVLLGGGTVTVDIVVREPVVSNGTDTYTLRCGLIDSVTTESTDGVYFKTDSTASANWRLVTVNNTAKTEQDSSPAQTVTGNAWFHGRIAVNAAASSVTFSVIDTAGNATALGTIATNIPSAAGRGTGIGCMTLKSAGTTATQVDVDLIQYEDVYTTGR